MGNYPRPGHEHTVGSPDNHMAGLVGTGVPVYAGYLHQSPLLSPRQVGTEKGYHAARVQEGLRVPVHDPHRYCRGPGHPLRPTGGQQAGSAHPLIRVDRRNAGLCRLRDGPGDGSQLLGHLPVLQLPDEVVHCDDGGPEPSMRLAEAGEWCCL